MCRVWYSYVMNAYIFLRHAKTKKDPLKHATQWELEEDALEVLNTHIQDDVFKDVDMVITSTEPKAIATAKPIAKHSGLEITSQDSFNEIKREEDFLTDKEFLIQKQTQLESLDTAVGGPESGRKALQRFEHGLQLLEEMHTDKTMVIVSHGTVLSLYFASLLGTLGTVFERWGQLKFCAFGVVKGKKVIRDIM